MTQLSLRPIARNADPATSHASARHLATSGDLGVGMQRTLRALAAWPGGPNDPPTSHELAGHDLRARYQYARRLADLRDRGLVENGPARTCRITGRQALTWIPTRDGAELAGRLDG